MVAHPPDIIKTAPIETEYIELDKLLKREDVAASGGEARYLIGQGLARVNGEMETRKRRKLYPGDLVRCQGVTLLVVAGLSSEAPDGDTSPEH